MEMKKIDKFLIECEIKKLIKNLKKEGFTDEQILDYVRMFLVNKQEPE